jgi:hypothetical protein
VVEHFDPVRIGHCRCVDDPGSDLPLLRGTARPGAPLRYREAVSVSNPIGDAIKTLNAAREEMNYVSRCQTEPSLWDGVGDEEPREKALERAFAAGSLCIGCEVFKECDSLKNAIIVNPDGVTSGTYAGDWIAASPEDFDIRYHLDNGQWPEEE